MSIMATQTPVGAATPAPTTKGTANAGGQPADTAASGPDFLLALVQAGSLPAQAPVTDAPETGELIATLLDARDDDAAADEPTDPAALLGLPLPVVLPLPAPLPAAADPATDPAGEGLGGVLPGLGSAGDAAASVTSTTQVVLQDLPVVQVDDSGATDSAGPAPGSFSLDLRTGELTRDAAATSVTRTVHVPVTDRQWPSAVGHEVRMLLERGVQSATLRLSPDQLGPVEVRIEINSDKASVWFGAAQAETRTALTDALPRLRDMLAASGLMLTDSGVHREAPRPLRGQTAFQSRSRDTVDEVGSVNLRAVTARIGLVDEYV